MCCDTPRLRLSGWPRSRPGAMDGRLGRGCLRPDRRRMRSCPANGTVPQDLGRLDIAPSASPWSGEIAATGQGPRHVARVSSGRIRLGQAADGSLPRSRRPQLGWLSHRVSFCASRCASCPKSPAGATAGNGDVVHDIVSRSSGHLRMTVRGPTMKSALSLMLIACLLASTVPLAAQKNTEATTDLLAAAITREAVRLAALDQNRLPDDWQRVRTLAASAEIVVTVTGSQPLARYYVRADEVELTVLNLSCPTLPPDARRVLLATLSHHPEAFGPAPQVRKDGTGGTRWRIRSRSESRGTSRGARAHRPSRCPGDRDCYKSDSWVATRSCRIWSTGVCFQSSGVRGLSRMSSRRQLSCVGAAPDQRTLASPVGRSVRVLRTGSESPRTRRDLPRTIRQLS